MTDQSPAPVTDEATEDAFNRLSLKSVSAVSKRKEGSLAAYAGIEAAREIQQMFLREHRRIVAAQSAELQSLRERVKVAEGDETIERVAQAIYEAYVASPMVTAMFIGVTWTAVKQSRETNNAAGMIWETAHAEARAALRALTKGDG